MSSNSFEKINYSLRPAKSIERKMIMQFLNKLFPFEFPRNYHYIGFGSIYYSDFILFHRQLHIEKLSSIEFERNEERARFNLPYQCISLESGSSNQRLPSLMSEEENTIAWLDYDSPLKSEFLDDIQTFVSKCGSGSKLLLTTNVNADKNDCINGDASKLFEFRKSKLKDRISESKIPYISKPQELNQKNLNQLYRRIIINEIVETLNKRNTATIENEKIIFKQVMNFIYSDGAKMQTLGFIFYKKYDEHKYNNCNFSELDTFRDTESSYEIIVPKFTCLEVTSLNRKLPLSNGENLRLDEITDTNFNDAADQYANIYKYFPQFSESLY